MENKYEYILNMDKKSRAQILKNLFKRLKSLLSIHSGGYLLILYEQVDELYINIRNQIEAILDSDGLEELNSSYPRESIPRTLHSMGEDADIYWESQQDNLNEFTGKIIEFCVLVVGKEGDLIDLAVKNVFDDYDKFIDSYKKDKEQKESNWLKNTEIAGKKFQDNFIGKNDEAIFICVSRIEELKKIKSNDYDLLKLIEICIEINKAFNNESYIAVAMLVRAILDHIPPIFSFSSFREIACNYNGGSKSFKASMNNLENSSRKIADSYLHTTIRKKEILPNKTQINFSQDLDFLLSEIVRILK